MTPLAHVLLLNTATAFAACLLAALDAPQAAAAVALSCPVSVLVWGMSTSYGRPIAHLPSKVRTGKPACEASSELSVLETLRREPANDNAAQTSAGKRRAA